MPLDPRHTVDNLVRLRGAGEAYNCGAGRRTVGHAILPIVNEESRKILLEDSRVRHYHLEPVVPAHEAAEHLNIEYRR